MVTLQQALDSYLIVKKLKRKTMTSYKSNLERCVADFLPLPLCQITKVMCITRHRELCGLDSSYATLGGKAQANLVFRTLRAVINFAIEYFDLKISNPVESFSILDVWAEVKARNDSLKETQLFPWYKEVCALPAADRDFYLLIMLTGMRKMEAALLTWAEVDFEARMVKISDPERIKNSEPLNLALSTQLVRMLRQRWVVRQSDVFVFPSVNDPNKAGDRRAHEKVGDVLGFQCNPHQLRRTFATMARYKCGKDYELVKRCLNHSTRDITDRYIKKDPEELRPTFQAVADYFFSAAINPKPRIRLTLKQVRNF